MNRGSAFTSKLKRFLRKIVGHGDALAPAELLQAIELLEPTRWEPADRSPPLPHQVPVQSFTWFTRFR